MNFEEFIKSQKEQLHTETPSFSVWTGIQKVLTPRQKKYSVWAIAASVVLVLSLGIWYLLQNQKQRSASGAVASNKPGAVMQPAVAATVPPTQVQPVIAPPQVQPLPIAVPDKKMIVQSPVKPANPTPNKTRTNQFQGQNFYDSTILVLKRTIESTPVKWVDQSYFTTYLTQYKSLEAEENEWKKKTGKNISETDFIIHLIQINQQKIDVLANLLKQIKNINTKKGDTAQNNYSKIVI